MLKIKVLKFEYSIRDIRGTLVFPVKTYSMELVVKVIHVYTEEL